MSKADSEFFALERFLAEVGAQVADRTETPRKADSGHARSLSAIPDDGIPNTVSKSVNSEDLAWSSNLNRFWASAPTKEVIPAGKYHCSHSPSIGFYLEQVDVNTDDLLELPDDAMEEVFQQFNEFWEREKKFRERGLLFKRGWLFWGNPGGGKSASTQLLVKRVIKNLNGIVIVCDHPETMTGCIKMLRRVEPTRPLLVVLEDIDALIERHGESQFLSLLDGESQIDSVTFVATTNYPGRLPPRLVDRPSRFDIIREVGMPSAEARAAYLRAKEKDMPAEEVEDWVERSDGFSIAHLKEMITAIKVFDQPIDEVVERLRLMGAQDLPSEGEKRGRKPVGMIPLHKKNGKDESIPVGWTPVERGNKANVSDN